MPTPTDKFKTGFFLRTPGPQEPPITYTFTELGRLLIDLNSRFAKVNNAIAGISSSGGSTSDLTPRVVSLEQTQAVLIDEVHSLGIRVSALENPDNLVTQDELAAVADALSSLIARVTTVESRLNSPPQQFDIAAATTDFDPYSVQEADFNFNFLAVSASAKFCSTVLVTAGTLPPEITFAGIVVDVPNNKVLVRFQNNTPTLVTWPACSILLHTFY